MTVLIQAASLRSAETGTLSFTKQIKYVFRNSTPKKDLTKAKIFSEEEPQRNKPGSLRPANCRKAKLTATSETAAFALTRTQRKSTSLRAKQFLISLQNHILIIYKQKSEDTIMSPTGKLWGTRFKRSLQSFHLNNKIKPLCLPF